MKTFSKTLISLAVVACSTSLAGQTKPKTQPLPTAQAPSDSVFLKEKTNPTAPILETTQLNGGNFADPLALVQGRLAGVEIFRVGSNPNENYAVRSRGISSINGSNEPLIVADGVPSVSLLLLDAADIRRVGALKSAASMATLGIRGNGGALLFDTYDAQNQGFTFQTWLGTEGYARRVPNLSAADFIANGGNNYGSTTDWEAEVSRKNPISSSQNLRYNGDGWSASVNFRQAEGKLNPQGFQQLNGRLQAKRAFFNGKLTLSAAVAATSRQSELGFEEANYYARVYNPTAPVYSDTNAVLGGYYQKPYYNYFNPKSIVAQNWRRAEQTVWLATAAAEVEILRGLNFTTRFARQSDDRTEGTFLAPNSGFWGHYAFVERVHNTTNTYVYEYGWAIKNVQKYAFDYFAAALNYDKKLGKFGGKFSLNYDYQRFTQNNWSVTNFGFDNHIEKLTELESGHISRFYKTDRDVHNIVNFNGTALLDYKNFIYLNVGMSRAGSTRNGANEKFTTNSTVGVALDFNRYIKNPSVISDFRARIAYGRTAAEPYASYLSLILYDTVRGSPIQNENLDLRSESRTEWNTGVDVGFFNNRLTASVDFYTSRTKDFVQNLSDPRAINFAYQTYANAGEFENRGVEISLNLKAVENNKFTWQTGFNFSSNQTEVIEYYASHDQFYSNRSSHATYILGSLPVCICNVYTTQLEEAKPLGQLYGAVFESLNKDGRAIFKDVNKDGQVNEKDWTTLGYGLPSLSSSWHNRLTFKHLQIDFILRGVFGHSIVNIDRLYFENNSDSDKERNRIRTSLAEPNLKYAFYGSLFVEDASFIRLDNLQVSYNFDLKRSRFLKKLTLQFAAQNLFTMTNFTGDDPEVRYDVKSESYGYPHLFGTQALVYGMENQYSETRLTRTFSIGLKAGF